MRVFDLLENTNPLKQSIINNVSKGIKEYGGDAIVKKPDGKVTTIKLTRPAYVGQLHPFCELELISRGEDVQVTSTRYSEKFKMPDVKTFTITDSDDLNKFNDWFDGLMVKQMSD